MSQDLIKALEDLLGHVLHWERSGIDALAIYKAEEALSRHRSSVESVELPEEAVAVVEGFERPAGKKFTQPNLLWYVDFPNMDAKVKPGDKLYTASTVRSLIAAAVERATEEANRRANASWSLMVEKMVAIEREQCAKVCDGAYYQHIGPLHGEVRYGIAKCAAAIRARGEK